MVRKKDKLNYTSKTTIRVEARINYDKSHIKQTGSAYYINMVIVKKVSEFNRGRKTATYYERAPLQEELPLSSPVPSRAKIKVRAYLKEHKYDPSLPIEIYGRHSLKRNLADKVISHAKSDEPLDIQE